jgi:hypothetical protein
MEDGESAFRPPSLSKNVQYCTVFDCTVFIQFAEAAKRLDLMIELIRVLEHSDTRRADPAAHPATVNPLGKIGEEPKMLNKGCSGAVLPKTVEYSLTRLRECRPKRLRTALTASPHWFTRAPYFSQPQAIRAGTSHCPFARNVARRRTDIFARRRESPMTAKYICHAR